jgi:glutathione S-transferase
VDWLDAIRRDGEANAGLRADLGDPPSRSRLRELPMSGADLCLGALPPAGERPLGAGPRIPWRHCDTDPIVPRLYYMPRTRSSRVLWLLAEIGAPYQLTKLAPEERTSVEHLARHPLGRVPALELDDGTVMFESAAICLQLADLHPDAGLIAPLGSVERALVYQWVAFGLAELEGPLFRWVRELAEDPTATSTSRERFEQAAAAVQTALGGREWLVADRFGVADVICASVLGSAHARGLLGEWPRLQAYVERAESRPAFVEAAVISNQPRS